MGFGINNSVSSFSTTTTITSTTTSYGGPAPRTNPLQELGAALGQLAAQLLASCQGGDSMMPALPTLPSAHACPPRDPYQAAYESMDPRKAAQTLLANFDAVEGVGVDEAGHGARDANIGRRELERVADANSGFPPDIRAACRWLLDHPTSARSIDQGASQAQDGGGEYHFGKPDLQAFVASEPASAARTPSRAGSPGGSDIQDVYAAARVVRDHFKFIEGVGMNDTGRGANDDNIGVSELRRVADPNSGAPEQVRQAAAFLLSHPIAMRSLDQGASQADGNPNEVHIGSKDVDAFLANAPAPAKPVASPVDIARLIGQLSFRG